MLKLCHKLSKIGQNRVEGTVVRNTKTDRSRDSGREVVEPMRGRVELIPAKRHALILEQLYQAGTADIQ